MERVVKLAYALEDPDTGDLVMPGWGLLSRMRSEMFPAEAGEAHELDVLHHARHSAFTVYESAQPWMLRAHFNRRKNRPNGSVSHRPRECKARKDPALCLASFTQEIEAVRARTEVVPKHNADADVGQST